MPSEPTAETLLDVRDITVSFDGFKAITNLSLQVPRGSLRVLIGPNGAGKSTLLDTIIGKVRPERGEVRFGGQVISRLPEHRIAGLGICRKFQAPGVLEGLTVRENLLLTARRNKGVLGILKAPSAAEHARADELLRLTGLTARADIPAGSLAHGEKQWLEIGMVVAADPELLLLDEPTAGMTAQETAQTAALIHTLAGRHTVLVIDHDMHFVELLKAPITVLHQGQVFREGNLETLRADPEVMEIYLGRPKEAV
ncbi:urea transport system ATP-binding protein [Deinococcus metalli]|uniref:ABC transporter ATP-binding protein n=1 Tax=Deinococcus metalli TaxID=1141878 RepID=A0A7W8KDH2_9DEIO|nr:urea ABC transporter ATP-binding protein UrtD [Deinococcus metalli]MBB5375718.1 urea transport system ATP-binding protein [Deinococcus metalli]GHF37565.1 ABC transporter ATP-binding protein [Deinococcus metalli]